MTGTTADRSPVSAPSQATPRVVLADRHDALVPHLHRVLASQVRVVGQVDAELTQAERLTVAAATFRPSRRAWVELFYKSGLAVSLRSRRAGRRLAAIEAGGTTYDAVFQTHALFEVRDPRSIVYVDCTHRQSADQWPDWNPLRGRALRRWYDRERRQYATAAHLFAFSPATRDSLVHDYDVPPEKVTVVYAGVNFDELLELPELPGTDLPPTVLFVGNDFVRKGGPQLLQAFAIVRETLPDARLRIVGTPYPVAPQAGVEVIGRVHGREAMSQLYREATVFCLPTLFDPFPLVLLEAMAHEVPVVATDSCGIPEMVDPQTGILLPLPRVSPGVDPTATADELVPAIAQALLRVLTDPGEAARLGRAGRRRVQERFLWTHVVDAMMPAFRSLTAGSAVPLPTPLPTPSTIPSLDSASEGARR